MKGIILAGGSGTRLYPLTKTTSKQLLPIYDKPMIYYSLSVLMLADIKDILIITTPEDISRFKELLGNGAEYGINIEYAVQEHPNGIAEAFIIGKDFIKEDSCALILGDNFFYGNGLYSALNNAKNLADYGLATIFGYEVKDPERFGVVEFNNEGKVLSIKEKPVDPKSNYAVTGLYFYPSGVCNTASYLTPSDRNELEITDLNNIYLHLDELRVKLLNRGYTWSDVGTVDSLIETSNFVKTIQKNNKLICSPEEIAFRKKWITKEKLLEIANKYRNSSYGEKLKQIGEKG